jgi:predicted nucleic acid-binding protein
MSNSSPANKAPIPLYAADTVALILRLEKRTMGAHAHQAFLAVEQGQADLLLPAMVCSEMMYLAERKRITATIGDVERYLARHTACREAPLTLAIVKVAQAIRDIPELHDRLIAATAVYHNATLLTNDMTILASTAVQTLW